MKKKIVVITPNFYPENFPLNNIVELLNVEYEVEVLTNLPSYRQNKFYKDYSFLGPYRETINGINIFRVITFPRLSNKKIFILLHYLVYFISMFSYSSYYFFKNRKNINFILTYSLSPTFTALFGIIGSRIAKAKHFNWVQDIWPESIISSTNVKKNIFYNLIEIFQNYLFSKSELIAQSEKMKIYFEKKYKKKIYQLNNIPRKIFEDTYISKNIVNKKIIFSYFGNIGKAQRLDYFLEIFDKIKNKNIEVNIFGSGSEKKNLMEKYKSNIFKWHRYKDETDLLFEYNKTNFFLLPIEAINRQKYILPGKFSSYLFFCRPILGFSNRDSALENYIKNNQLGEFINIDEKIEKKVKIIENLLNKKEEYYEDQYINAKNFYNKNFSTISINKQIREIFI